MKRLISLEAERHRQLSRIVWSGLSGGIGEEIVTSLDRDNGNFLYPGLSTRENFELFSSSRRGLQSGTSLASKRV
jgi:hypothetical protein